jgi:hypothetical protein
VVLLDYSMRSFYVMRTFIMQVRQLASTALLLLLLLLLLLVLLALLATVVYVTAAGVDTAAAASF